MSDETRNILCGVAASLINLAVLLGMAYAALEWGWRP